MSFFLHVVLLLILALIVTRQEEPRRVAIVIENTAHEEPIDLQEPQVELPVGEPDVEHADPEPAIADIAPEPFIDPVVLIEDLSDADMAPLHPIAPENVIDLLVAVRETRDPLAPAAEGGPGFGDAGQKHGAFGGEVGRRLAMAGAGTGDIQVSLAWNNFNDIDLHVVTPAGERIFFGDRLARCGGCLDVDMNVAPQTPMPVENVFWPQGSAPGGVYSVFVHHFRRHVPIDPTPFELYILVKGRKAVLKGVAVAGQGPVLVAQFDLEGRGLPMDQ